MAYRLWREKMMVVYLSLLTVEAREVRVIKQTLEEREGKVQR